jgi:hypothetical protein
MRRDRLALAAACTTAMRDRARPAAVNASVESRELL